MAINAGNDMIITSDFIPMKNEIIKSVKNNKISEENIARQEADEVLDEKISDKEEKRYLRLAVLDGEGFSETDSLNRFRLVLSGLKSQSRYTIGITAFDSSGNYSGSTTSAEMNQMFILSKVKILAW